jgi:FtsP/CotA-like multicopper oxidase with cupredoxin domain
MTETQAARAMDGDLQMHTASTSTARVASSCLTGLACPNPTSFGRTPFWSGSVRSSTRVDVSSAGRWMAHCHIAEHIESGVMFSLDVLRPEPEVIR